MRNRINSFFCRALSAIAVVLFTQAATAVPVIHPAGLNPGDPYRLAYVTSTVRNAFSPNIADYNTFVNNLANGVGQLAGLGTTWTAIASTGTTNARVNTGTLGVDAIPIYNLNGEKIADTYGDLWDGDLDVAILYDETGTSLVSVGGSNNRTWTGTNPVGNPNQPLGSVTPTVGFANFMNQNWIIGQNLNNDLERNLYGMSGTLSAVPLPPAAALLGIPLLTLLRRRVPS